MSVGAIVTAAGSGSRLGHVLPKALVPLGDLPLVVHAVRAILGDADGAAPRPTSQVTHLVVTAPGALVDEFTRALAPVAAVAGHDVPPDGPDAVSVRVVAGGATRQASVAAGLAALPAEVDVVLVHDAARALVPAEVVDRVVAAVHAGHRAVVPALDVTDTIKRVDLARADQGWPVVGTVPREELRAVQTPQGFDRDLLARAHEAGGHRAGDESLAASDDAGLVEALGEEVWVVPGHPDAAKITTPWDLAVAALVLAGRDERRGRP
ncbi:2-C-methyl-D-erythritol 4-phosphate cytidylyltransferase [Cellulomonas sp. P22]|uniref:2-C-methyl-D-erythritol 4-phosphate cytidylyltransferase n=1 Tax=Cellulomonas sp. P22 TaxID=3373189 RepID=UPI0037A3F536